VAEISGSKPSCMCATSTGAGAAPAGVHEYDVDAPIRVFIPTHKLFVFDAGALVQAPGRRVARSA
jgi:hypothetical protein